MGESHTPTWPRYLSRSFPSRLLAIWSNETGEIITEDRRVFPVDTFEELYELIFALDLILFCNDLATFPFRNEIAALFKSKKGEVMCNRAGTPIAAWLRGSHNRKRWIVSCTSWNYASVSVEMLDDLRQVFEHCKVGERNTPGALAHGMMNQTWKEQNLPRHTAPNGSACEFIRHNMTGGRADAPAAGRELERMVEIDQNKAYLDAARRLPTGTSVRIGGPNGARRAYTWFCRCNVQITRQLALGIFPLRGAESGTDMGIEYPTRPGEYQTFIWKEEAEKAEKAGCHVEIIEGWGWNRFTENFAPYIALMERLMETANEVILPHLKASMVSGFGRFGMAPEKYILVPDEEGQPGDVSLAQGTTLLTVLIREIKDYINPQMVHWYNYIVMQCRLALYDMFLPFAEHEEEELYALNYDAGYVKPTERALAYVTDPGRKVGEWKGEVLRAVPGQVPIPQRRHLIVMLPDGRMKIRRPGVQRRE